MRKSFWKRQIIGQSSKERRAVACVGERPVFCLHVPIHLGGAERETKFIMTSDFHVGKVTFGGVGNFCFLMSLHG